MRKNKYESNLYYEEICRKNYKFKTFITIKVNFVINFKKKFEKNGSEEVDWAASNVYSRARSHYCSTRELLPAVFPPWVSPLLFSQPGHVGLPQRTHIDVELSADTRST